MKKTIKKTVFALLLFSFLAFISGCEDPEVSSDYRFEVISADGTADGYYIVDGGDPVYFTTSLGSGTTVYYYYDQDIDSPSSITIFARGTTTATTSITIYIYVKDVLKDSISEGQTDTTVLSYASLSYTFTSSSD